MRGARFVALAGVVAIGAVAAMGVAGGTIALPGAANGATPDGASPSASAATVKTADVDRRTLQTIAEFDGTLAYEGSLSIAGQLEGTLTKTPAVGTIVKRGETLYEVDGSRRAVLLYGARPAWRALRSGIGDGADILQLERNLETLGHAGDDLTVDHHWDADTTAAVKRFQKAAGLKQDGILSLGEVVFLGGPIRVVEGGVELGARLAPGAPVLAATWTRRSVTVNVGTSDQDELPVGTQVSIDLPDDTTTPGTVAEVGTTAAGQGGGGTSLPVTITPDDPRALGALDGAPVTVSVVTGTRENVLTVPVTALLALREGGYAVEVVAADGDTVLRGVELGLFDGGRVEVTGVSEGDKVVVP